MFVVVVPRSQFPRVRGVQEATRVVRIRTQTKSDSLTIDLERMQTTSATVTTDREGMQTTSATVTIDLEGMQTTSATLIGPDHMQMRIDILVGGDVQSLAQTKTDTSSGHGAISCLLLLKLPSKSRDVLSYFEASDRQPYAGV